MAVETLLAFVGGMPPAVSGGLVAVAGMVQLASVIPGVQLGAEATVRVALAVVLVLVVLSMKSGLVVLPYAPLVGAVIFTLMIQLLFGAMVPPENDIEESPACGLNVGEPQPVVEEFGGLATNIEAGEVGKGSVKLTPLMATGDGLTRVTTSVAVPPGVMESGTNRLVIAIDEVSIILAIRLLAEKSEL